MIQSLDTARINAVCQQPINGLLTYVRLGSCSPQRGILNRGRRETHMRKRLVLLGLLATFSASGAVAQTCTGNCGTDSANGVVTAPPGGGNYQYVSTSGGAGGAGQISSVGGTNGSEYVTSVFSANSGDALNFNFNYVTSDGAGYADYAFAE